MVALLVIYLAVLFVLARLLEAVSWYEQGQISRQLLDPMTLSVLRLKALLEQRGFSYDNLVEKSELAELVEATGNVTQEELEAAATDVDEEAQITNYTSHIDFFEQVEDAKDSMWLIEINTDTGGILSDTSWHLIKQKVGKFGVRLGKYNCQQNARLCTRKGWFTSQLVLALPENYRSKANVALYTYPGPVRTNSLFDWIKSKVDEQVTVIEDSKQLEDHWLTFDSSLNPDVRVLFVSTLSSVPLFLSALSVKFPGRVKLAHVKANTVKGKEIVKKLDVRSTPSYIVVTKDRTYLYGQRKSEIMTFRAMEMFLKSIYPSMNDIFVISLIFTNVASVFELAVSKGGLMRRTIKLLLCMFKYNMVLFLVWITILTLLQIPLFTKICFSILKCLRWFTLTSVFSLIRKDILYYSYNKILAVVTLIGLNFVVTLIRSRLAHSTDNDFDDDDEESEWWNFSNLRTLNYYNGWEMMRLRPFDQIFNPSFGGPNINDDYEPVRTVNSTDYVKLLPVWMYRECECNCKMISNFSENTERTLNEMETASQTANEDMDLISPIFPDASLDDGKCCVCDVENVQSGQLGKESQRFLPPKTSFVSLEGPGLGMSHDHPWDGTLKITSKMKKVENLNRCLSRPVQYIQSHQCVICLDHFSTLSLLRGLPCKHVFHDKCILTWLLRNNHFCPVCRWPSYQSKEQDFVNDLHSE